MNNYEEIQRYISVSFVGAGRGTYTVASVPKFDNFLNYFFYIIQNISTSIIGPLNIVFSTSVGPILFLEGLLIIIPLTLILFRNIINLIRKTKFRLSKGLTDFITIDDAINIFITRLCKFSYRLEISIGCMDTFHIIVFENIKNIVFD